VQGGQSGDGISPLLGTLANAADGRSAPEPAETFAPLQQPVGIVQEISLPLLWLALALWPLDIAARRLLLRWSDVAFLRSRLPLRRRPAESPAPVEATVARLQSARSRLRRPAAPNRAASQPPAEQQKQEASRPAAQQAPAQPPRSEPAAPAPQKAPPPAAERKPPRPQTNRPPAARSDDALANLLAAKQRARRRQRKKEDTSEE
jgi:hypothetical protein